MALALDSIRAYALADTLTVHRKYYVPGLVRVGLCTHSIRCVNTAQKSLAATRLEA